MANSRRKGDVNGDQEIPPQGEQVPPPVPNDTQLWNFTLPEFTTSIIFFAQALIAQANREMMQNLIGRISAYMIREFLRMNPVEFSVSKVEEDANGFIYEVYKKLTIMGLDSSEEVELSTYQLKDVSQVWYEQWNDNWQIREGPI